jgi:hypothetical protein
VLGFYHRRLRDAGGKPAGKGGAVVVVQRTSADRSSSAPPSGSTRRRPGRDAATNPASSTSRLRRGPARRAPHGTSLTITEPDRPWRRGPDVEITTSGPILDDPDNIALSLPYSSAT